MVARSDCTALNFRTNQLGGSSILTWKKKKDSKQPACLPVNALPSLLACILSKRLRSRLPRAANHSGPTSVGSSGADPPGAASSKAQRIDGCGWVAAPEEAMPGPPPYRRSYAVRREDRCSARTGAALNNGTLSSSSTPAVKKKAGHAKCCPRPDEACARLLTGSSR